jgi:hypothetical protein
MAINGLRFELSVMEQIAVALIQLDEPTRARVLHWAEERFHVDAPVAPAPAPLYAVNRWRPSAEEAETTDEALSVSTLGDFFDPRAPKELTEPTTEAPGQSVNGMLHDFVVEFQDVAHEWNGVCSGPADAHTHEPVHSIAS